MKLLIILGSVVLLLLALAGVVGWIFIFDMLKESLLDGTPVFFEYGGVPREFSGRLVGILALAIPIACALIGIWLIRVGIEKENGSDV